MFYKIFNILFLKQVSVNKIIKKITKIEQYKVANIQKNK